jgi:hypothetical protein
MRNLTSIFLAAGTAALAVILTGSVVTAHPSPCDFLTGGGFVIRADTGAKANFGIGGGCKHGSPTWGHLQYHDHGTGLNVHWLTITGYMQEGDGVGDTTIDPKTKQPIGSRLICGTARTNQFGEVDFMVRAQDKGEPGVDDLFFIRLSVGGIVVYTTEHDPDTSLGGDGPGGGNIQLHKPNPSTFGEMGGECAAREAV